jgi:hypothetical protein
MFLCPFQQGWPDPVISVTWLMRPSLAAMGRTATHLENHAEDAAKIFEMPIASITAKGRDSRKIRNVSLLCFLISMRVGRPIAHSAVKHACLLIYALCPHTRL